MSHPGRTLAAALLVAGLAVPATLHAAALPQLRLAAHADNGTSLRAAELWSLGWFFRLVQQAWTKNGGTLDPSGGARSSAPQSSGLCGDTGGTLDPNGGCTKTNRDPASARRWRHSTIAN